MMAGARTPRKRGVTQMATFDLILSGGDVVNQDGIGARDVGVRAGRIAEIGDLSRASAGGHAVAACHWVSPTVKYSAAASASTPLSIRLRKRSYQRR